MPHESCGQRLSQRAVVRARTSAALRGVRPPRPGVRSCIAACRSERCTALTCGMLRAAKIFTAVSVSIVSINCSCTSLSALAASISFVRSCAECDRVLGKAATLSRRDVPSPPARAAAGTAPWASSAEATAFRKSRIDVLAPRRVTTGSAAPPVRSAEGQPALAEQRFRKLVRDNPLSNDYWPGARRPQLAIVLASA
jgi:hypothetical protein